MIGFLRIFRPRYEVNYQIWDTKLQRFYEPIGAQLFYSIDSALVEYHKRYKDNLSWFIKDLWFDKWIRRPKNNLRIEMDKIYNEVVEMTDQELEYRYGQAISY